MNTENETETTSDEQAKQWIASIQNPKQQAIAIAQEIARLEKYVIDRQFAKQEQEKLIDPIKLVIEEEVKQLAATGPERGGPLSSEAKVNAEINKRIQTNEEYLKIRASNEEIDKDVKLNDINISFYKRTFQILIAFANEWTKVN